MELPEKVEMELKTAHPYLPGGYLFFLMDGKDQERAMKDPPMHYGWESPFYKMNDQISFQIALDVEQNAKSALSSRLFNNITAEMVIFPKDQGLVSHLKGSPSRFNDQFELGVSNINYLGKFGSGSHNIGIKYYRDGKLSSTQIHFSGQPSYEEIKGRFNFPPALSLYLLDRAEHRISELSQNEKIELDERQSFDINRAIAVSRLRKQADGNEDLLQLVDSAFKSMG